MNRFVYFYFNRRTPERISEVIPAHVCYWQTAHVADYQGGPFADRTGGLIVFAAKDLQQATAIIRQDPFVSEDLIEEKWIKEWLPE
jgi:uncharacterized protein YciI